MTKHIFSALTVLFGSVALASFGGCDDDVDLGNDSDGGTSSGGSSGNESSSSGGGSSGNGSSSSGGSSGTPVVDGGSSSGDASPDDGGTSGDAGQTQCEQKGGACVGLVPGACQNTGNPAEYSCGPGVGVLCCLDDAPTQCETEGGECVGLNPDACPGGTTEGGKCGDTVGVTCCKQP